MSALRALWVQLSWDLRREMRCKRTLVSMAMVGLITLFLFSFALPPTAAVLEEARSGILWVAFLLAATIGIERAFGGDGDGRLLEGLLLAPVQRSTVYLAKVAATAVLALAMEAVVLVLFLVLFDQALPPAGLAAVALAAVLATVGFAAVGVLLGSMTHTVRGGEILLRVLLFPMLIPVFYAAVSLTEGAFRGRPALHEELAALAAFDLVFLGAGCLLFEHVVRELDPL